VTEPAAPPRQRRARRRPGAAGTSTIVVRGERLFQKNPSRHFPEWIARARIKKVGGTVEHVIVDQAATLVYLANQACITVHAFLSRLDQLQQPDQLIFDLDPPGHEFSLARKVALDLRGILEDELGLPSFVKTTGGDGLHVMVPLDRTTGFDAVREASARPVHDQDGAVAARRPARSVARDGARPVRSIARPRARGRLGANRTSSAESPPPDRSSPHGVPEASTPRRPQRPSPRPHPIA